MAPPNEEKNDHHDDRPKKKQHRSKSRHLSSSKEDEDDKRDHNSKASSKRRHESSMTSSSSPIRNKEHHRDKKDRHHHHHRSHRKSSASHLQHEHHDRRKKDKKKSHHHKKSSSAGHRKSHSQSTATTSSGKPQQPAAAPPPPTTPNGRRSSLASSASGNTRGPFDESQFIVPDFSEEDLLMEEDDDDDSGHCSFYDEQEEELSVKDIFLPVASHEDVYDGLILADEGDEEENPMDVSVMSGLSSFGGSSHATPERVRRPPPRTSTPNGRPARMVRESAMMIPCETVIEAAHSSSEPSLPPPPRQVRTTTADLIAAVPSSSDALVEAAEDDDEVRELRQQLHNRHVNREMHKVFERHSTNCSSLFGGPSEPLVKLERQLRANSLESMVESKVSQRLKSSGVLTDQGALLVTVERLRQKIELLEEERNELLIKMGHLQELSAAQVSKINALEFYFRKLETQKQHNQARAGGRSSSLVTMPYMVPSTDASSSETTSSSQSSWSTTSLKVLPSMQSSSQTPASRSMSLSSDVLLGKIAEEEYGQRRGQMYSSSQFTGYSSEDVVAPMLSAYPDEPPKLSDSFPDNHAGQYNKVRRAAPVGASRRASLTDLIRAGTAIFP